MIKRKTTIDYKGSDALHFKDRTTRSDGKGTLGNKHRQDLIRDVAAMANAEGGVMCHFSEVYSSSTPCGVTRITAL